MATFAKASFAHSLYAVARPSYPATLYEAVLKYHAGPRGVAVDLGCGHGVVTRSLSKYFTKVIGVDPSKGMIDQAVSLTPKDEYPNVEYKEGVSENIPFLAEGTVDMVTAGQAAHWFDYPTLFPELQRILRKGGSFAFWGYKDHVYPDFPNATRITHRYSKDLGKEFLGSYWPQPGRDIVEDKLRRIVPPSDAFEDVQRIEYEPGTRGPRSGEGTMFVTRTMKIGECKEYIRTWSSYHGWQEAHPDIKKRSEGGTGDVVDRLFDEIAESDREFADDEHEIVVEWGSGLVMGRRI